MNKVFFLNQSFVGFHRLFASVCSDQDVDSKKFKTRRYHLPKHIIKNHNMIINIKNFYDQSIDSDTKRYKETRKLATGQGEDNTTGYLLDCDYI